MFMAIGVQWLRIIPILTPNIFKYCSFFQDDECRLFVKTYEEGDNPGEYMFDIFNPDGIFISRKSLNIYSLGEKICAMAKRNRLYCLREKKSGYKELVVYKMRWGNYK